VCLRIPGSFARELVASACLRSFFAIFQVRFLAGQIGMLLACLEDGLAGPGQKYDCERELSLRNIAGLSGGHLFGIALSARPARN
jgi:hypothetical protein